MSSKRLIAAMVAAGTTNSVAAAVILDNNMVAIIGAVIGTVTLTLAVVSWIDKRIDNKLRNYADIVSLQFNVTMREISNLRELEGHAPLNVPEILRAVRKE